MKGMKGMNSKFSLGVDTSIDHDTSKSAAAVKKAINTPVTRGNLMPPNTSGDEADKGSWALDRFSETDLNKWHESNIPNWDGGKNVSKTEVPELAPSTNQMQELGSQFDSRSDLKANQTTVDNTNNSAMKVSGTGNTFKAYIREGGGSYSPLDSSFKPKPGDRPIFSSEGGTGDPYTKDDVISSPKYTGVNKPHTSNAPKVGDTIPANAHGSHPQLEQGYIDTDDSTDEGIKNRFGRAAAKWKENKPKRKENRKKRREDYAKKREEIKKGGNTSFY